MLDEGGVNNEILAFRENPLFQGSFKSKGIVSSEFSLLLSGCLLTGEGENPWGVIRLINVLHVNLLAGKSCQFTKEPRRLCFVHLSQIVNGLKPGWRRWPWRETLRRERLGDGRVHSRVLFGQKASMFCLFEQTLATDSCRIDVKLANSFQTVSARLNCTVQGEKNIQ